MWVLRAASQPLHIWTQFHPSPRSFFKMSVYIFGTPLTVSPPHNPKIRFIHTKCMISDQYIWLWFHTVGCDWPSFLHPSLLLLLLWVLTAALYSLNCINVLCLPDLFLACFFFFLRCFSVKVLWYKFLFLKCLYQGASCRYFNSWQKKAEVNWIISFPL